MPDIELLTALDRSLIEHGIIREEYADEYYAVHEVMKRFRAGIGMHFSTKNLAGGEAYLRAWLARLGRAGEPKKKLTSFLRCGLAHLCRDFIEFTFESIPEEEITHRAFLSFTSRGYPGAVLRTEKKGAQSPNKNPLNIQKKAAGKK